MKIESALIVPVEEQICLFNKSFEGYLAGFSPMDAARFGNLLRSGGIDLSRSLIAFDQEGTCAGLAYATVYAGTTRLAAMGVAPEFRRNGCADKLLKAFIGQAAERKSRRVTLEVFEQNTPAVKLYSKSGFATSQRLYGYQWKGHAAGELVQTEQSQLSEMLFRLMRNSTLDDPYQFSLFGMLADDGELLVTRHKTAWIAYRITQDKKLLLKYLADEEDNPESMKELVWAIAGKHNNASWTIPQIVPERLALAVLEPLGFERLKLNQIQMNLELG